MAVKIPQYESRLTPSGFDHGQFNPAQMTEEGANIRKGGQMIVDAGAAWKEAVDKDTALAGHDRLLQLSEEHQKWITNEARANPDLVNNPDYPNVVKDEWNKRVSESFKDVQMSDKVKAQINNLSAQIGHGFFSSENSYSAQERVNTRLYQIGNIQDSYVRYAIQSPESYDYVMQGMDATIENAQLTQAMKLKLKADARHTMAYQVGTAIKETNPELAAKIWKSAYRTQSTDDYSDIQVDPAEYDQSQWGKRPDGSDKGAGWLGLLRRPDGGVSSEISVGVEINGKETTIPILVPTLTRKEVDEVLAMPADKVAKNVPDSIMQKAEQFAKARIAQGLSPFAGPNESPAYGGAAAAAPKTAATGDFKSAVDFVLAREGGFNPNDGNGYPVNFGINGKSHPGIDIKNLTKDQAAQILKTDYWDKIGADKLPADVATVAFDAAVNQGVGYAKKLLQKSGGDVDKMIEMRRSDYEALAKKDPSKAKYLNGWMNRLDAVQQEVGNMATTAPLASGDGNQSKPTMAPKVDVEEIPGWAKALVRDIDPQHLPSLIASTDAELNRRKAEFKADVITRETNDMKMAEDGVRPPQMLTIDDYTKAFGADGATRFENYQKAFVLGDDRKSVSTMTDEQQDTLLAKYAPDPNRPEAYGVAKNRRDILAQAINDVRTERAKDPMGYAIKNKIGGATLLDFNKPMNEISAELTKRNAVVQTLRDTYHLPAKILTDSEAKALNAGFAKLDGDSIKSWLKGIKTALPNASSYYSVLQQISPDHPVSAYAGEVLSSGFPLSIGGKTYTQDNVASKLLRGEQLLNKSAADRKQDGKAVSMPMPKENDMIKAFNDYAGNAFSSQTAWNIGYQAFKAYYAATSEEAKDYSGETNSGRFKESAQAVLGDTIEINGTKIIPPWGMSGSRFKDELKKSFDGVISANNYKGSMFDQFDRMDFESISDPTGVSFDNFYLVKNGGSAMFGRDGKPIVIRVSPLEAGPPIPGNDDYRNKPQVPQPSIPDVTNKADKSKPGNFKTK